MTTLAPKIVSDSDIRQRLPPERSPQAHKYSFGKLQLVAGSRTYPGAALLCALGAFKAGCGYVCLESEAPVEVLRELPEIVVGFDPDCSAFVIGPGLEADFPIEKLQSLLDAIPSHKPLLFDGGALRLMGELKLRDRTRIVVTPHEGELANLLGSEWSANRVRIDRVAAARLFIDRYPQNVLLLKGSPSLVLDSTRTWILERGNASMATAGQGDLLSGVIGAYLALGISSFDATLLGSALCALSAERLSKGAETQGVLAHEVAQELPFVLKDLRAP